MKKLTIDIYSFSYKKKGIPLDPTSHGGGFVFDCRVLPNPGREDAYKRLSGLDLPVKEYLSGMEEVTAFLQAAYALAGLSIDNYLERGFEHLMFSFGCTGGQHRSVYCAEALYRFIQSKYSVKVYIHHQERDTWIR